MGLAWEKHRFESFSVFFPWIFHVISMQNSLETFGMSMEKKLIDNIFQGFPMNFPWKNQGKTMVNS